MGRELSELQDGIARALAVRREDVKVERYRNNRRGTELHGFGSASRLRFFAKMLTRDPFPLTTPFSAPWHNAGRRTYSRPAGAQVEVEYAFMNRFAAAVGREHICTPLGRSVEAKTIVWEFVEGENLDHVIAGARWRDRQCVVTAAAIFQAASWLRKAHSASIQENSETVDVPALIEVLPECLEQTDTGSASSARHSRYAEKASALLKSSLSRQNDIGKMSVPVALSHGDFSLSNLIWAHEQKKLFVVDFEHASYRPVWHDPVVLISNLRLKLLNPLVPVRVIGCAEGVFWEGYGPVSPGFKALVNTLASAWVFYAALPWFCTSLRRRGWLRGTPASIYGLFLEYCMVPRRLLRLHGSQFARVAARSGG